MVRFAVTCPTPTQPKQTKIGMQGKRQRLFISLIPQHYYKIFFLST